MYILYIVFLGCLCINGAVGLNCSPKNHNGYISHIQKIDLQMRAKKNTQEGDIGKTSTPNRATSPVYNPRTPNQKRYVKYLGELDTKIVMGVGAAGSGKTLFACYTAIQELRKGMITKIIMTRPVVPVENEEIGFLPGSLVNKMDPWTRPIFDILLEFYTQKDIDAMLHGGVIEISPLAYMRGRTFKRAFIIADEMQNSSPNQMLMLTTRLGEGSKMVITGDLKQSDRGADNGLLDLLQKVKLYNTNTDQSEIAIKYVELESADVQRSAIVAKMLDIYEGRKPSSLPDVTTLVPSLRPLSPPPSTPPPLANYEASITPLTNNDAALIPIHHISKRNIKK